MKSQLKKVLIVEDEDPVVYTLNERFKLMPNVKTFYAEDGVQGLEMALREKPDLILLDIVMPKLDGLEMLGRLRKDPWGKKANVIVLSNLSHPDKEKEAKRLGVADYVIKADSSLEDVMTKVKGYLK